MKTIKHLALAALAATLLFQTPIMRADDQGPRTITFEKCTVADGTFQGTVTGDCGSGTIAFKYLSVVPGPAIWRFSGEYTVASSGCSFTADCSGIVDISTGHVVLNGLVVTAGPHLGARVQVRAQANATLTCSSGTMTITPNKPE